MAEPDKTVLEVAKEIGESATWIKAGFGSSDLADGYESLLASEATPAEALQAVKNDIVESLDKGEISRELANVMTAIINKSGTDSKAFAGNVISNIDKITAGLAAPAAAPKVAEVVVKKDEPVLGDKTVEVAKDEAEPEKVVEVVKPTTVQDPTGTDPTNEEKVAGVEKELGADVKLNDPADAAQQNNFMALLASGEFDIKEMMGKLDFAGNPMQAIMGLITMFSAMSEGKDPMKALEAFQNKQNKTADLKSDKPEDKPTDGKPEDKPTEGKPEDKPTEDKPTEGKPEDKPTEDRPEVTAITYKVAGLAEVGADQIKVDTDFTGVTANGQSAPNRFNEIASQSANDANVTTVDPKIDQDAKVATSVNLQADTNPGEATTLTDAQIATGGFNGPN